MKRFVVMAALAALPLSGCEHGIDFEGTVIAPSDVQQRFSAEAPGQLIVVAALPSEQGELRDADTVFCMPVDGDRRISVRADMFGCAKAGLAQVSAYAVPRTTAEVDCRGAGSVRAQNGNGPNDFSPDDAVAVATVEAPLTTTGVGGCQDGSFTFTVTLALR